MLKVHFSSYSWCPNITHLSALKQTAVKYVYSALKVQVSVVYQ